MLVPDLAAQPPTRHVGRAEVVTDKVRTTQVAYLTGKQAREFALSGRISLVRQWCPEMPYAGEPLEAATEKQDELESRPDLGNETVRLKPTANGTTNWTFCFVSSSEVILLNRGLALASSQGTGGLVTVATTSAPSGNGFASQRWFTTFSGNFVFLQNENTDLWLRVRNNCCSFNQTVTTSARPT